MDYNGLVELESTAADSAAIGKGTFLLADIRETVESGGYAVTENGVTKNYKTYLVRRLADGNCWMVQNLDLNLKTFAGTNKLTSENTDLSVSRTDLIDLGNGVKAWDPSASLRNNAWHTTADPNTTITGGYANHLGQANILEPGPGYDTVGALSITDYQFQDHLDFGPNLYWGSRYQQNTTIDNTYTPNNNGLAIDRNANSVFPRSYNNGLGYLPGTQNVIDAESCSAGNTGNCKMPGAGTNKLGSIELVTQSSDDGIPHDTTWQPEFISNSNGATYTMRGSMYIGQNYNQYAALAESMKQNSTALSEHDSICPSGWKIPSALGFGSFKYLYGDAYQYVSTFGGENKSALGKIVSLPTSVSFTAYYDGATGGILFAKGYHAYHWTSTLSGNKIGTYGIPYVFKIQDVGQVNNDSVNYVLNGASIRCVNKGSNQETVTPTTCSNGQICYNGNGADSGSTASQTASSSADTVLTAPGYVRSGYAFAGWSTSPNGYGTIYGPNESIDATGLYTTVDDTTTATSSLQLYAKWIKSSGTMQDFTATQCTNMKEHEVIALTDNRDGNTYSVAKLKDGNCWMTSNLALNLADFAGTQKLTTENTDISPREAKDAYGNTLKDENDQTIYNEYWDPSESMRIVARQAVKDDTTSKYANNSSTYGVAKETLLADLTGYGLTYDDTQEEHHQFTVTDTTKFANKFVSQQNYFYVASEERLGVVQPYQFQKSGQLGYAWGSYYSDVDGVKTKGATYNNNAYAEMPRSCYDGIAHEDNTYFNWYGLTAESGTYSMNTGYASDSVCPSGWQLPTAESTVGSKSYKNLIKNVYSLISGDNGTALEALKKNPFNFVIVDSYQPGGLLEFRNQSFLMTSAAASRTRAGSVYYNNASDYVSVVGSEMKDEGMPSRCVQK